MMAMLDDKLEVYLRDKAETDPVPVRADVEACNNSIFVSINGYGDASSADGCGCPVMIELYEGELRVVV